MTTVGANKFRPEVKLFRTPEIFTLVCLVKLRRTTQMLAFIALFFPAAIMVVWKRRLFKEDYDWKAMLMEYVAAVLLINFLVIMVASVFFGSRGNFIKNINTYNNFALKYVLLALALAIGIPYVYIEIKKLLINQEIMAKDASKDSLTDDAGFAVGLFKWYTKPFNLQEKPRKILLIVGMTLLVFYDCLLAAGQIYLYGSKNWSTIILFALVSIPITLIIVRCVAKIRFLSLNPRSQKKALICFFIIFILTFTICFLWHRAYWPGSTSSDSISQYSQVLSGEYNNWHPVLHTWIFFAIPMFFYEGLESIIIFQSLLFSLSIGYLFYTLSRYGVSYKIIIVSWLFLVCNPITNRLLLYPMKDSAMSIFALILFVQIIKMLHETDTWMKSKWNWILFGITAFLTNEMRHNAILLVGAIFVVLLIFMKKIRKGILGSALVCLSLIIVLHGVIYNVANVTSPDRRQEEILGFAMTILCDNYVYAQENLDDDAITFLESLTDEETWAQYTSGSFNSIKWVDKEVSYKTEEEGTGNILRYTLHAAINNKAVTLNAIVNLTKMVWQIDGGSGWSIPTAITENSFGIEYHDTDKDLQEIASTYFNYVSNSCLKYLFKYTGVMILIMLVAAVARIGKADYTRLFLVLAPMCYNFGTMFLLSGPDFRFFHFNFLIIVPMLFLLFTENNSNTNPYPSNNVQ